MKALLLFGALCFCSTTSVRGQLIRFHHVLPQVDPPADVNAVAALPASANDVTDITTKLSTQAVKQSYPKVTTKKEIRYLYRELTGAKNAVPIYTGRPGIWATVKMSGTVPVVDVWQIRESDTEARPTVIRRETDLKAHQIEVDLTRDNIGEPTRVVKIPFRAFLVSYNTVPLRVRWASRDGRNPTPATTNLSFAVNVGGVRGNSYFSPRGVNHYGYAVSLFGGATTVALGKAAYLNQTNYDIDRTNLALSGGLAVTLIRNNIGLVAALGADHCTGKKRSEWIYQNKPWLGFGISTGLGFF